MRRNVAAHPAVVLLPGIIIGRGGSPLHLRRVREPLMDFGA